MCDEEKPMVNGSNGVTVVNGTCDRKSLEADNTEMEPPDGGTIAWLVMIGSFLCNGILFGVINTYSVLYEEIYENLSARNVTDASSKAALVGSLAMGTTFMVSPVSGVISDAFGIRRTTFLGGAIATTGMFLSSIFPYNVYSLYVTYGVMYGLGCALAYTPSLAIIGHYFKRYMGVVSGVVTTGSAVFTAILPNVIAYSLKTTGIVWTLRLIALMASGIMFASLLFKPIAKKVESKEVTLNNCINVSIFRNKKYLIWSIVLPISLFGYFVPYVHMTKFVQENYSKENDGKWPVICIGVASGIGRLIFGYVSDFKCVNRVFLQQISLLVIGGVTTILPSTAGSFSTLIAMTLLMGLFDGCFISMLGPIAFDLCGQKGATQGIGMLLGLCSVPLTLGPYLAGILYDHMSSYHLAFRISGVPPILGAIALCLIRFVDGNNNDSIDCELRVPLKSNSKKTCINGSNGYHAEPNGAVGNGDNEHRHEENLV